MWRKVTGTQRCVRRRVQPANIGEVSTGRQAKMARQAATRAKGAAYGIVPVNPAAPRPAPRKPKKPKRDPDLWRLLSEDPAERYGGDRLKLPGGVSVRLPDKNHPGCAALRRVRAGDEQPGDREQISAWIMTMDPRYVAYLSQ